MRRGFTLIEVMIASFIGLLVMGCVLALFAVTAKGVDRAEASYDLEQLLVSAIKPIQTDLRYTTLASIKSYPQSENPSPTEGVGVSMLSADPLGEMGNVQISRFGTADWQKHVFYTLVLDSQQSGEGHLVRYEQALTEGAFELVSSQLPYDVPSTNTERVIIKKVLMPGYSVKTKTGGEVELLDGQKSQGGFQVRFLQADGTTTYLNPTRNTDPSNITRLVIVSLTILEQSERGKMSALPFEFRVMPRN